MIVIGVDPGPCTGICVLRYPGEPSWYQADAGSAYDLIANLARYHPDKTLLAVETFVPGRGPGARQHSGAVTRNLIFALEQLAPGNTSRWRAAGMVKPWATDARIHKAGLYMPGMHHAVDAARHALYCAVHDGGMPDPLSRKPGPWREGDIVNALGEIIES